MYKNRLFFSPIYLVILVVFDALLLISTVRSFPYLENSTNNKLPGNEPRQLKSSLWKKTVHESLKVIERERRSWGEDEHKTWSVGRFRMKAIRLSIGSRFHRVNRRFERY